VSQLAKVALAFSLLGFLIAPASAARISSFDIDADLAGISIEGDITSGDAEAFRREAAKHSAAIVLLESDGGSTLEAIEIGEAIRLKGFSTLVVNGSQCASACGLVWLAGSPRILSHSGRVGFHATYIDDSGRRIESGLGNALVGRYLTLLNLPMKAVVFATSSSPSEVSWLTANNLVETGIEARLIDDWQPEVSQVPNGRAAVPPPIQTRPMVARKDTEVWQKVSHWSVMVDYTLGGGCFITSAFEDGTLFRIGLDRRDDLTSYVLLANADWRSLSEGKDYGIELRFDDEEPWSATAKAIKLDKKTALSISFSDNSFWGEFAAAQQLAIKRGERKVTTLSLDQSRRAVDSMIACQKANLANEGSGDPFSD
jgi:hypothetical protein